MTGRAPDVPRVLDRLSPWLFGALVLALVAAAVFLRQTGVPKAQTIWAEDGEVFAACTWARGPLACLVTPYAGYLHVVPRLGAAIATAGDVGSLSLSLTTIAAVVAGAAVLAAALAVRDATSSWASGLLSAIGLILVYQAGREVAGNLTNVHSILFAASAVVLVCSWLGRSARWWDLVLVAAASLTTALAPLLVILAVPPVLLRRPKATRMLATVGIAAGVQLAGILLSERSVAAGAPALTGGILSKVLQFVVNQGWFGPGHKTLNRGVIVLLGAFLVALGARVVAARRTPVLGTAALELAAVASLVLVAAAGLVMSIWVNHAVNHRYAYLPAALVVVALALGVGVIARALRRDALEGMAHDLARGAGRVLPLAALVILLIPFAQTFRLQTRASNGPDVRTEIAAARTTCRPGAVAAIRISPVAPDHRARTMLVPCEVIAR